MIGRLIHQQKWRYSNCCCTICVSAQVSYLIDSTMTVKVSTKLDPEDRPNRLIFGVKVSPCQIRSTYLARERLRVRIILLLTWMQHNSKFKINLIYGWCSAGTKERHVILLYLNSFST